MSRTSTDRASRATQAARRHFDRWSATYEQDATARWLRLVQARALGQLQLRDEDRLLDLGCGTGAAVRMAAPAVASAVGFDLSPGMIERARALAGGLPDVTFREGDAARGLPFADGAFTAVVSTTAFHHFQAPERVWREVARVLAPGGRALVADANAAQPLVFVADRLLRVLQTSHVGLRSARRLRWELLAAGLTRVRIKSMWFGCYALVQGEKRPG